MVDQILFDGGALVPNTGWGTPGKSAEVGPLIGGRAGQMIPRSKARALAKFQVKADVLSAPATLTDDATNAPLYGATSLRFNASGTTTINMASGMGALSAGINIRYAGIRIWLRPGPNFFLNVNVLEVRVYSSGSPASPATDYHKIEVAGASKGVLSSQATTGWGRWQPIGFPTEQMTAVGAGATLTAITYATLHIQSHNGNGGGLLVELGNVEFVPNPRTKAAVLITFDDGRLSQFTEAAARMARYGFPATMFIGTPPMTIGLANRVTVDHVKHLHDHYGWQIGGQAATTETNTEWDAFTDAQRTAAYSRVANLYNSLGLTGYEDGSYFSNVTPNDMTAFPAFRQFFRSVRAFGSSRSAASGAPLHFGEPAPFGDPMAYRAVDGASSRFNVSNGYADHMKVHIDQAVTNRGVAALAYHDELLNSGNIRTCFDDLLANLDSRRDEIDVLTVSEFMRSLA